MNATKFDLGQAVINSPISNLRRSVIRIAAWIFLILGLIIVPLGITTYLQFTGRPLTELRTNIFIYDMLIASGVVVIFTTLVLFILSFAQGSFWPGVIMTSGLTIGVMLSDTPLEIKTGRSTIFLALPIVLSAITVRPSFAMIIAFVYTLFLSTGEYRNTWASIAFWILAGFVWLSTSLLERSIQTSQLETNRIRSMLGIISHELRTPLSSIKGYSDLLLMDKSSLNPMQLQMITRAQSSALSLIDLVNNILDITHIQSGRLTILPKSTSTANLLEAQMDFARQKAREKGLDFQFTIENLPPVIIIDETRLRQIAVNLTDNAIKFTKAGMITLTISAKEETLLLTVKDTGVGISKEDLSKIFLEFVQAQNYVTREQGGIGLGLSIVYNLVKKMGGEIKVESTPKVGTTMMVTLPLHIPEENKV